MRLALYQPDIPQNTGTILRLAACLGVAVDIIEPAGFDLSDRALRRAGLDYLSHVRLARHMSFAHFMRSLDSLPPLHAPHLSRPRLVLLTTAATLSYVKFTFHKDDILLLGRESAGVPDRVHAAADARVRIPMVPPLRSLNVAMSAAMVLGEALRQCALFPSVEPPQGEATPHGKA